MHQQGLVVDQQQVDQVKQVVIVREYDCLEWLPASTGRYPCQQEPLVVAIDEAYYYSKMWKN
jgi:hypothetical protein